MIQRDLRGDRVEHRGPWVASGPLAILDAAVAPGRGGRPFLDRALQRHVTLDELRVAQARHLGRRGSGAAGRLVAQAGDRAASGAERAMLALLRRAGLSGWSVNLPVALSGGRHALVDVAFRDVRLAIEVDGWAGHVGRDRFVSDRVRTRLLVAAGWTVIEVTWDDLHLHPEVLILQIRRILLRLSTGSATAL